MVQRNGRSRTIEPLKERREELVKKFARKAESSERFGSKWFMKKPSMNIDLREGTRNKYKEPVYKNKRLKNNPVNYMTRLLNNE